MDPPADGAWNMALDELLLIWTERTGQPIFRLYQWAPAVLSLGYFQRWQDRFRHPASLSCPMVRRPSGGGAIVHDRELTYGVAVPYCLLPQGDPSALYGLVHESLVELFGQWGLKTHLWECSCRASAGGRDAHPNGNDDSGQADSSPLIQAGPEQAPFLCFQRRSRWDVVADGPDGVEVKLVGSAQRRTRLAVLQHGSILLGRSPAAPELLGLSELLGRSVRPEELQQAWLAVFQERLGWIWQPDDLTPQQHEEADRLVQFKYGANGWTLRR